MVTLVREQVRTMPNATPSTIREILAIHGIVPFNPEQIDRYKSWQLRRHTPLRSQLIWFAVMRLQIVFLGLFVGGFCLIAAALFMIDAGVASLVAQHLQTIGSVMMWVSSPTIIGWFICWRIFGQTHVPYPYWTVVDQQFWHGDLPPHAEETARIIREHLPSKTILIDILMFRSVEVDPIMFIYDEYGKRLNLAVWGPNVPPV